MPSDDTENHFQHVQAPPCDDCAKEQKRLAMISMAVGMAAGAGVVFLYLRSR